MTAKGPATLIAPPKNPVRPGKGEPPSSGDSGSSVGNHTQKPESTDMVDFNMRVPADFKRAADTFMAANGLKRKAYVMQLIKKDMESKGWDASY